MAGKEREQKETKNGRTQRLVTIDAVPSHKATFHIIILEWKRCGLYRAYICKRVQNLVVMPETARKNAHHSSTAVMQASLENPLRITGEQKNVHHKLGAPPSRKFNRG